MAPRERGRLRSVSRTYLVTGAAGFIGSHTAIALLRAGHRVVGIDNYNDYYDPSRKRANTDAVRAEGGDFLMVEGDIRDRELIERVFRTHPFDAVAHLAAMAGVRRGTATG